MSDGYPRTTEKLDPHVVKLGWVLVVGAIAALFDVTIVNVALHTLAHELQSTVGVVQWVVTGYLLALGAVIPATGWALERFGGKRLWLFSLALFLASSVLAGVSWNIESLIAFRVLQGVAGGIMLPTLQTLIVRAAGGRNLGQLMAIISLPAVVAPIIGPVLGGIIVDALSWRWMFYINVPIILFAIALAWRNMPTDTAPRSRPSFDLAGTTFMSLGLTLLIYGLAQIGSHGGFSGGTQLVPTLLGLAFLVAFVVRALGIHEPAVDLRLFKYRSFAASISVFFLSGVSLYGTLLLLPLFYQQVQGATVLLTGLFLAPQDLGALLSRIKTGKLADRIGERPVALGGIVLAVLGTLPFALQAADLTPFLSIISLLVLGVGQNAMIIPIMAGAYKGIPSDKAADASSATRIAQQIGGAFGAAVIAIILQHGLTTQAAAATAFGNTFWWTLGFTLLALIPVLALPKKQSVASEVDVPN